ncbi:uroporphyrinogen decarboxylase [Synechococcus sp. PCC 7336]|uniref:uroporphyrinogen decarboxylase n=1 Tax=Synechococcus sp. PCC 7336 TaxID=195250 RepID=UPI0003476960|nr:uroporphyrinogen decarboxylase [Synechococcus sp. PCC 7336]
MTHSISAPPIAGDRLLRAARGEVVDRPPVWMMRQAGRYMQEYRVLREKYSFKERCEQPELAVEISLQPFRAFRPDGVIMFSDILTPLDGMGIPFDLVESVGPIIDPPIRTRAQVDKVRPLNPEESLPFIKEILSTLRSEIGDRATLLGFVGAPWTLAAYAVEGKSSKDYAVIKQMAYSAPEILHQLLGKLADSIARYVCYQIECGAQVVQMFDTWAGQLNPIDYEAFALPYEQRIVEQVRQVHPDTPLVLYINGSGALLERVGQSGVNVFSVDWLSDIGEARQRLGPDMAVQGNLDPMVLLGSKALIRDRTLDIIRKAGPTGHIMNLGHGIHRTTPEENVRYFFETVQSFSYS